MGQLITRRGWETIAFINDKGEMTSRVCTRCGELKSVNNFTPKNMANGLSKYASSCKECINDYVQSNEARHVTLHRRRALENGLPSTMTLELREKAKAEQGYKCILTGKADNLSTDHFTSLSWGTGLGDTYENTIFIDRWINTSKGNRNPFSWIRTQDREIQKRFYNDLVPMLANRNDMTVKEFEDFVNNEYAKYEDKKGDKE